MGAGEALREALAWALYRVAGGLLLPGLWLRSRWRARREPRYAQAWHQRLGLGLPERPTAASSDRWIWVHAVSLGETRAARPLIEALQQHPLHRIWLTTGTATGWDAGVPLLRETDRHSWAPLDVPGAATRFVRHVRPHLCILLETETWPGWLRACEAADVPVIVANARLSERSLRKGLRTAALTRPMMRRVTRVLAQTADDAQRFEQAGVAPEKLEVTGHLKYDVRPEPHLVQQGQAWRAAWVPERPVIMAASWREEEERDLLAAWTAQLHGGRDQARSVSPLLVWVPRHPQRFDAVEQALRAEGLRTVRRSAATPEQVREADVLLGDSVGEMPAYYALADVALLGGSFAPLGGQNLIEAAACGCPVVMGPHTFNFAAAAALAKAAGVAIEFASLDRAIEAIASTSPGAVRALTNAKRRSAATAWAAAHQGATARMVQALRPWLAGL